MNEFELHTVVLEQDVPVDARKLGKPVARILALPLIEARLLIRKGRGVFAEDLTGEQAEAIVALLTEENIAARAIPATQLPPLPRPIRVAEMFREEKELKYRRAGGAEIDSLPWANINFFNAGAVALPEYQGTFSNIPFEQLPALHKMEDDTLRDVIRENIILKMDQNESEKQSRSEDSQSAFERLEQKWSGKLRVAADLVSEPRDVWLRIFMDEFAYGRQTGAVKLGSAWGFAALLEDLREKRGDIFSDMTLRLDSGADIKPLIFSQFEEFDRYSTWLIYRSDLAPPNSA